MYGSTTLENLKEVKKRLESANARWTKGGWVVEGDLNLHGTNLIKLPKIKLVSGKLNISGNPIGTLDSLKGALLGGLHCDNCNLTSLKGSPETILLSFDCSRNKLRTLQYAPKYVGGSFYCESNKLTSLRFSPKTIGINFSFSFNSVKNFRFFPKFVGADCLCNNNKITSFLGSPEKVIGNFYCQFNRLTSYESAPKRINGDFYCYGNKIKGQPKDVFINGEFWCTYHKKFDKSKLNLSFDSCNKCRSNDFVLYTENKPSNNWKMVCSECSTPTKDETASKIVFQLNKLKLHKYIPNTSIKVDIFRKKDKKWYYKLYADDLEYCSVAFPIFNEVWFTQLIYSSVLSVKKNKHEYEV